MDDARARAISRGMADKDVTDWLVERGNRLTLGILSDPKDREPVVPPDLHLTKPTEVDADGNITCIGCGKKVPFGEADIVGSAGMACRSCRPSPVAPAETTLARRKLWPWLVGIPVAITGVVYGIWHHDRAMDREEYERQYPVANAPGDDETISHALARWQPKAVIAGVSAPPALATLHLGAACAMSLDHAYEVRSGDADDATGQIASVFQDAKRGRYYDEMDRQRTLARIGAPVLVVAISDQELPEMTNEGSDFYAGRRAGTAYVYDIDGKLACAGAFEASSSDSVKYWTVKSDNPVIAGDQRLDARRAVTNDLDKQTHDSILAGLKRVE